MILLLTFEEDYHGNQLVYELHKLGFNDYLRVDSGRLLERNRLEISFVGGQWWWQLDVREAPDLRIDSESLRTVWFHRLSHSSRRRMLQWPERNGIDSSQAYCAMNWLIHHLSPERFPFGSPAAVMAAENKISQVEVAVAVGFDVAPTLYSTDPATLADFARENDDVVVKTIGLQSFMEADENGGETMAIFGAKVFSADQLIPLLEGVEQTQLYLQRAVEKVAEHRITVLPDEVIDCRIDTSGLPFREVDYRPHCSKLACRVVEPPPGLESKLRAYLQGMRLGSGCFDFAELADGSLVFFECNPVGEWFWIQQLTGHPISESVARNLVRHHELNSSVYDRTKISQD